jgi:hypothetical protein
MVGLHFGVLLIFLLDYFDASLKDPNDFESDLGVAVLATVPKVYRKKDILLKKINTVLTVVSIAVAVCLFAGFAAMAIIGVEPTIELVQNPSVLWATNNSFSK